MSKPQNTFQKAAQSVTEFFSNKGLMRGAKNPTPYFGIYRMSLGGKPSAPKTRVPVGGAEGNSISRLLTKISSTLLPGADVVDDGLMRYITSITVTRAVGGSDKKPPKNECQLNIQFSVDEARSLKEKLREGELLRDLGGGVGEMVTGDYYMNFPYFTNAQKVDEKVYITAGYLDLDAEDCFLDAVALTEVSEQATNRRRLKKGRVVKNGLEFRPFGIIFGGIVSRPSITGAENGLVTVTYSLRNPLSQNTSVAPAQKTITEKPSSKESSNSEQMVAIIDKEIKEATGSEDRYQNLLEQGKFGEALAELFKLRVNAEDGPPEVLEKIERGSTPGNYTKLLKLPYFSDTFLLIDIPDSFVPFDPDRFSTAPTGIKKNSYAIDSRYLNTDKPPLFTYTKSFPDLLQRIGSVWGLAYLEHYFDDGKSVIRISPAEEFLPGGKQAMLSFKPDPLLGGKYAILLRYGIEVISFSYNQKPAIDVAGESIAITEWDVESSDWVTYKLNKDKIKEVYEKQVDPATGNKLSNKEKILTLMLDMARSDPDSFIIMFTNIAGEYKKTLEKETVAQGAGVTLSLKLKHPIPGLLPGMSIVFDIATERAEEMTTDYFESGADVGPSQILPIFVSRPIYQISKVVTKLEGSGTIYSQEIECEG